MVNELSLILVAHVNRIVIPFCLKLLHSRLLLLPTLDALLDL